MSPQDHKIAVFAALDAECVPLADAQKGINLDSLCQLVDRHLPDPVTDGAFGERLALIDVWATARGVRITK